MVTLIYMILLIKKIPSTTIVLVIVWTLIELDGPVFIFYTLIVTFLLFITVTDHTLGPVSVSRAEQLLDQYRHSVDVSADVLRNIEQVG